MASIVIFFIIFGLWIAILVAGLPGVDQLPDPFSGWLSTAICYPLIGGLGVILSMLVVGGILSIFKRTRRVGMGLFEMLGHLMSAGGP